MSLAKPEDLPHIMELLPQQPFVLPKGQSLMPQGMVAEYIAAGLVGAFKQKDTVVAYFLQKVVVPHVNQSPTLILTPQGLRYALRHSFTLASHFAFQHFGIQVLSVQVLDAPEQSLFLKRLLHQQGFVCTGFAPAAAQAGDFVVDIQFWNLLRTAFYANPQHGFVDEGRPHCEALEPVTP